MDGLARALPYVLVLLVGYALLVRPLRKRAKETSVLQSMLSPGDQVMLTSGIFGRVATIVDDRVTVEIAPGVVVTVHRGAIGKIVRDEPAVNADTHANEHDDGLEDDYLNDDGVDHDYPQPPVVADGRVGQDIDRPDPAGEGYSAGDPSGGLHAGEDRPDTDSGQRGGAGVDGAGVDGAGVDGAGVDGDQDRPRGGV